MTVPFIRYVDPEGVVNKTRAERHCKNSSLETDKTRRHINKSTCEHGLYHLVPYLFSSPLRRPMLSMIAPWCSSTTSIVTVSERFHFLTIFFFDDYFWTRYCWKQETLHCLFSIRIERCRLTTAWYAKRSGLSVSSTRSATLWTNSFSRRSGCYVKLQTYLLTFTANGEVFTWKVIVTVGSSTDSDFHCFNIVYITQIVSEIFQLTEPCRLQWCRQRWLVLLRLTLKT